MNVQISIKTTHNLYFCAAYRKKIVGFLQEVAEFQ